MSQQSLGTNNDILLSGSPLLMDSRVVRSAQIYCKVILFQNCKEPHTVNFPDSSQYNDLYGMELWDEHIAVTFFFSLEVE